jgi:phage gp16-like protein
MLWTVARVRSAKDLDSHGCARVLEHMKSRGFVDRRSPSEGRPHNIEASPQLKKIEALLTVSRRPWAYVDSMARRMFSVDRIAFCNAEQLGKVIAALSIDQRRSTSKEQG